jgi:integrase/recombinase XerD
MTTIRQMLGDYLALRRDLGYKLLSDGTALLSFIGFLEESGAEYISTEHAVAWALLPTSVQAVRWWRRLAFVRGFARYCAALDPRTEVPPADLLPYRYERRAPFFFSDDEVRALLQAAIALPAKDGLANHTHYCLIGLLSVTGIRISEALNLTMNDVDLDNAVLTIHSTKFGKSRLVPLHQSTVKALADYRERRARFLRGRQVPHWFVNRQGKQVRCDTFDRQFRRLTDKLSLMATNG